MKISKVMDMLSLRRTSDLQVGMSGRWINGSEIPGGARAGDTHVEVLGISMILKPRNETRSRRE